LEPEPMEVDVPDPLERVRIIQRSVYYISEVHKLLHTVLIASRKLRHYF
jgi:hypothetical protein